MRDLRVVLALLLCPSLVPAQQAPPVSFDSGALVRIHVGASGSIRGRLVRAFTPSSPSLTFCPYPGPRCVSADDARITSIALSQVRKLDKAEGNHLGSGLLIGGLIGGVLGGFFVAAWSGLCDTSSCRDDSWKALAWPLGLGLGLGAAFGAASPEWAPVW